MRRALAWLVAVPLVLGGAQLAHAVDYWLIEPDAHERSELLAGTGHAYFSYLPFVVAILGALLVAALVAITLDAARGAAVVRPDRWLLALLPLTTFALQEHVERYVHDAAFPWHAVTEPTFVLGLVLQIPFAVAAYIAARLLVQAAEAIGRARRRPPRARPVPATILEPAPIDLPTHAPLASGYPSRGPPQPSPA